MSIVEVPKGNLSSAEVSRMNGGRVISCHLCRRGFHVDGVRLQGAPKSLNAHATNLALNAHLERLAASLRLSFSMYALDWSSSWSVRFTRPSTARPIGH